MSIFKGKTVIVTGAARGLGRDYAGFFARDGARVVVADVEGDEAAVVARALADEGAKALGVRADVTDPASVGEMVEKSVETFGGVDILVNNAAVWGDYRIQGVLDCELDYWNHVLGVNLTGALVCSRAVVPRMKKRGWGRIVNISSIGSWMPGAGVYGISKLALHQLTFQIAGEVGELGITCNAVAPGQIENESTRRQVPQEFRDALRQQFAIKRSGTSRDLYGAIRWLCTEDAAWVTGQVISPNGGFLSRF